MLKISKVNLNENEKDSFFPQQSYTYSGADFWDWSVWIDAEDPKNLDKIESVTYHLHNTFINPVRVIKDRASKFKIQASGWGTFRIYIVINLKDETVIEMHHDLELEYPDETKEPTKPKGKKKNPKK